MKKLIEILIGNHTVHSRARSTPKGIGRGKKGKWNESNFWEWEGRPKRKGGERRSKNNKNVQRFSLSILWSVIS